MAYNKGTSITTSTPGPFWPGYRVQHCNEFLPLSPAWLEEGVPALAHHQHRPHHSPPWAPGAQLIHHSLHQGLQGNPCLPCSSVGSHPQETVLELPQHGSFHRLQFTRCSSVGPLWGLLVLPANLLQHRLLMGSHLLQDPSCSGTGCSIG